MRIAVDAMGTDNRPVPDVAGAVLAARTFGDPILIVGDRQKIETELQKYDTSKLTLEVVHAQDEIGMAEKPSDVMKDKSQSSIHIGTQLIRDGRADGFVTMGNTGATHAIATLQTLRRIPGIKRPAMTSIFPVAKRNLVFVDIGANADSKAEWLYQFGFMGSIYAKTALKQDNPRVALLSNGSEASKGNQIIQEAYELMRQSDLNFIGNVEPKDIIDGEMDVVVTDGFLGNIFLKTFEGSFTYIASIIREELNRDLRSKLGGLLSRPAFRRVRKRVDTSEMGGAPLLGINGVVIIGHGSSDAVAVKNGVRHARRLVEGNTVQALRDNLQKEKSADKVM